MIESKRRYSVTVVIPVYRDGGLLTGLLESVRQQELPAQFPALEVLVVETEPAAATEQVCARFGASHCGITRADFDHGGTRSWAAQQTTSDLLVFLSQDVLLCDVHGLSRLLSPFLQDEHSAACYGRQLAPEDAAEKMKIKRLFSYPPEDARRQLEGQPLRHEQVLFSNAFGAYRRVDLERIGWFGERQLMCEDVAAVASLLAEGRSVHYVSSAKVTHRHQEGFRQELARAFDIGASHAALIERMPGFPVPGGVGVRFLGFGVRHLARRGVSGLLKVPGFVADCGVRWIAYSLGRLYRFMPKAAVPRMSLHPSWWTR